MHLWQTSQRIIALDRTLVMGILNVTPDSFSDGGETFTFDQALERAARLVEDGADILDVGGESTRPGSSRVSAEIELERVIPVIAAIRERFDVPVSVDTSKSEVAEAALAAGAEIINDVSGLRFDARVGEVAADHNAGLVLMHSRGEFETMHSLDPVEDILKEVAADLRRSVAAAESRGVDLDQVVLDVGIGFGKTLDQNLELIANIGKLKRELSSLPILVGASRKSFIGKIIGGAGTNDRLHGSLAAATIAAWNGADIVRVHDVRETVQCLKMVDAVRRTAAGTNAGDTSDSI